MGLEMADRYFPALMTVMFAGHTPSDAVYLSGLGSKLGGGEEETLSGLQEPIALSSGPTGHGDEKPN